MPARRLQPGGGGKERKAQPGGSCGKGVRFPAGRGLRRGGSIPGLVWDAPRVPAWSPGDAGLGLAPWERGAGGGGDITKANKTLSHQAAPSRIPARAGRVDEGLRVARNTFLGMRDWGNWGPAPASLRASFPPPTYSPWSRLGLRFVFFPRLEKYRFILRGCEV